MSTRKGQKAANRVVREQLARERRRRRAIWISAATVAVLVIAGLVGWGVWRSQQSTSSTYRTPAHATADGSGLISSDSSGPATVEVYLDYLCPHCKTFENTAATTLNQLVTDKKITLVDHPLGFLDSYSTNQYSTRAAAAAGCASDGGKLAEFTAALYANQPAEGGAGHTDDQLVSIGTSVGLDSTTFGQCVRDGTYLNWVKHVNDVASARGVTGTPTVFVNGTQVDATADAIKAAVG